MRIQKLFTVLAVSLSLVGCAGSIGETPQPNSGQSRQSLTTEQTPDRVSVQLDRAASQFARNEALLSKAEAHWTAVDEQQKRFDAILQKWEEQSRRVDALLAKAEKRK